MQYHVYFRRPNDCVVYAPATEHHEISLVHRGADGAWHCALCDATDCRHSMAALHAGGESTDGDFAGATGGGFTVPLPNG